MIKRKICIFLASSVVDLAEERDKLELFIRRVSDPFEEKYDTKVAPLNCEAVDPAMSAGRKQEEYNELIRSSQMCLFIFFREAGQFTLEEFDVAYKQFRETGKPKIYTYFKKTAVGEAGQSVRQFMEALDGQFQHYYTVFDHIDTVKLRILLNLKLQEMDFVQVSFEDGKCVVDGREFLDVSNVSEFANNKLLQEYQKEYAQINERYLQMRPIYAKGGYDSAFGAEYVKVVSRRQALLDMMEELKKQIFEVSLGLCRSEVRGELTQRQKEAYRLFELGDYEGCMAVLDADDIDAEYQRRKKQRQAEERRDAALYIREHRTAIEILGAWTDNPERFAEIERRYEAILPEAEEFGVELDVLEDYARYLWEQNKHKQAYDIALRLKGLYERAEAPVEEAEQAGLYHLLGNITSDLVGQQDEAENYYLRAIDMYEQLVRDNPTQYEPDLAMSYNDAGNFYREQGDFSKAETFCWKAIAISKQLVRANPGQFEPELMESYLSIGIFCSDRWDMYGTERFYREVIDILKPLAGDNPKRYNPILARCYHYTGNFYRNRMGAALGTVEDYYRKTFDILKPLSQDNPARYEPDLAESYIDAGKLYALHREWDTAKELYGKAIAIYERLAGVNPDRLPQTDPEQLAEAKSARFKTDLARSYSSAGCFYEEQGDPAQAEAFYKNAIDMYEQLVRDNPERYEPDLAMSYHNAGNFYSTQGNPARAEVFYKKAIDIYVRLARANLAQVDPDLTEGWLLCDSYRNQLDAEILYREALVTRERLILADPVQDEPYPVISNENAGVSYKTRWNPAQAEEFYRKAIFIQEWLEAGDATLDLAVNCFNASVLCIMQNKWDTGQAFYEKAIDLYEQLAQTDPERYEPDLAKIYRNVGFVCATGSDRRWPEDRIMELLQKAIDLYERLAQANPERYEPELARSYQDAGDYYGDSAYDEVKAEELNQKAIVIYERLVQTNPERYEPDLAASYFRISVFCQAQEKGPETKKFYGKAIAIYERLAQANPVRYELDLAACYENALNNYEYFENSMIMEFLKKDIDIYKRLAGDNPGRYKMDLAMRYFAGGSFYSRIAWSKLEEDPKRGEDLMRAAEEYFGKAIDIVKGLAKDNPERYEQILADYYFSFGIFYENWANYDSEIEIYKNNSERWTLAVEAYRRAIDIYKELALVHPEKYEPELAKKYGGAESVYDKLGDPIRAKECHQKALDLARRHPEHPFCREILAELRP